MAAEQENDSPEWVETSALISPALLGAAAGLLLGEIMHENARRGLAVGLGALGIATLLPLAVTEVVNRMSGPDSHRGARRILRGIRDAGDGVMHSWEEEGVV